MMTMQSLFAAVLCALLASSALANPDSVPQKNSEWTDHNEHDPGVTRAAVKAGLSVSPQAVQTDSVSDDLQKIVVLCATEQEEKFRQEWGQYVSRNKLQGAKLRETIAWVSDEAAGQRKRAVAGQAEEDEQWVERRRQLMSEVAEKALNPVR